MPNLLLDPLVLATPAVDGTREQVEKYVRELLYWNLLRREPWASVCISERALDCLASEGRFPAFATLREALWRHGIEHVDVNTVVAVINFILGQTPYLEERLGVREILADPIAVVPESLVRRHPGKFGEELNHSLAILAFVANRVPDKMLEQYIATRDMESETRRISITATILDAELTATGCRCRITLMR